MPGGDNSNFNHQNVGVAKPLRPKITDHLVIKECHQYTTFICNFKVVYIQSIFIHLSIFIRFLSLCNFSAMSTSDLPRHWWILCAVKFLTKISCLLYVKLIWIMDWSIIMLSYTISPLFQVCHLTTSCLLRHWLNLWILLKCFLAYLCWIAFNFWSQAYSEIDWISVL